MTGFCIIVERNRFEDPCCDEEDEGDYVDFTQIDHSDEDGKYGDMPKPDVQLTYEDDGQGDKVVVDADKVVRKRKRKSKSLAKKALKLSQMNPDDDGFVEKDMKEDADSFEHEDIKAEMDDSIDVKPKKKKAKDGRAGNKGAGRKSVDTGSLWLGASGS